MAGRCACATTVSNDECACDLGSTDAIAVTGSGAVGDPYLSALVLDPDEGNTASVSAAGLLVPGILAATSAERAGLAPGSGVRVLLYETDTDLTWKWNGSAWVRTGPVGLLGPVAVRDTQFTNATTSFTNVVQTASIHVPDGLRTIKITASWPKGENTSGSFALGIQRSLADGSSPVGLTRWTGSGDSTSPTAGAGGNGASYVVYEENGLPEDDYKWAFQARSISGPGGTTVIEADSDYPVFLAVEEI